VKPPVAINGAAEPEEQAIRLRREYVIQKIKKPSRASSTYAGCMQLFDDDVLVHGVIATRERLKCHYAMEFEYYNLQIASY
jgi:hypothetical protein